MIDLPFRSLDYLVAQSLTASFRGPAIRLDRHARLTMFIQIPSIAGGAAGLLSLQGRINVEDANAWKDIPGAFSELPGAGVSGALVVWDKPSVWSGLNFDEVALRWVRTAGTGDTLSAQYRVL